VTALNEVVQWRLPEFSRVPFARRGAEGWETALSTPYHHHGGNRGRHPITRRRGNTRRVRPPPSKRQVSNLPLHQPFTYVAEYSRTALQIMN